MTPMSVAGTPVLRRASTSCVQSVASVTLTMREPCADSREDGRSASVLMKRALAVGWRRSWSQQVGPQAGVEGGRLVVGVSVERRASDEGW